MKRPFIGRVESGDAKEAAAGHRRNAYNHSPVIVDFEFRAERGILQLGKLGVLHNDECVLAIDILDLSLKEPRPAEQTCIVEADDRHGLIVPIGKFDEGASGIDWNGVVDAADASHRIQDIVRHANRIRDGLDGRVHDPD